MKACSTLRRSITLLSFILALSCSAYTANADILVGAGNEDLRIMQIGPGGSQPPTQVFDVDTATGGRSNIQLFTQRGPVSLTAMDRDSSGVLWGIHKPNRLVTINESTGVVTDVVSLSYTVDDSLGFPEMVFVPGVGNNAPDRLFAIANFSRGLNLALPEKEAGPEGFTLVEINVATGAVTPFGMGIGGQYMSEAHGLEYDGNFGLIHMWYQYGYGGAPPEGAKNGGSGGMIEIIDLVTGLTTPVYSDFTPPSPPQKVSMGDELPGGFQAITHSGQPGIIYVYSDGNDKSIGPDLYEIQIFDNGSGPPTYSSQTVSYFQTEISMYGGGRVRAMERRAGGGALVIEKNGKLESYEPGEEPPAPPAPAKGTNDSGFHTLVNSVKTSVGGYSPYFRSLATDPVTGGIFGLASKGQGGPKSASTNKIPFENDESFNGLYIINRNGPGVVELDAFDIPLNDPDNYEKPIGGGPGPNSELTEVAAIAFDDAGTLFGITYFGQLVIINRSTGAVSLVDGFYSENLINTNGHQLEFNPDDGLLYLVFYRYSGDPTGAHLASFARDGSGFTEIAFPEASSDLDPESLVYAGNGSFFFTDFVRTAEPNRKGYGEGGSAFFSVSVGGAVSPPQGLVDSIDISALTKYRVIPRVQPDVLIGPSSSRLTGDGVYSPNGGGQSYSIRGKGKKLKGGYSAAVENDGNSPGTFSVTARGGKKTDKIKYSHSGKNVTAAIKTGYSIQLAPGQRANFGAKFSRKGGGSFSENLKFSAAADGIIDTGVVKVKIKSTKSKKGLKPADLSR